jgi:hypothetical protein
MEPFFLSYNFNIIEGRKSLILRFVSGNGTLFFFLMIVRNYVFSYAF